MHCPAMTVILPGPEGIVINLAVTYYDKHFLLVILLVYLFFFFI